MRTIKVKFAALFCILFFCLILASCATKPTVVQSRQINQVRLDRVLRGGSCFNYFVDMKVDDQIIKARLDTGATLSIIPDVEPFHSFPAVKTVNLSGAGGAVKNALVVHAKKIMIGSQTLVLQDVVLHSSKTFKFATLGANSLRDQLVILDLGHGQMYFNGPEQKGNFPKLDLGKDGRMMIEVSMNQQRYRTMIDTGSCVTQVDKSIIKDRPEDFSLVRTDKVRDLFGNRFEARIYRVKEFKFPGFVIRDALVTEADLSNDSKSLGESISVVLGANFMSMAKWYLDFKEKKWGVSL